MADRWSHHTGGTRGGLKGSAQRLGELTNVWCAHEEAWMKRLEPEVEREVRRLAAKGHGLREIGRILRCSRHAVANTLRRQPRPPSPSAWNPPPGRLSLDEREEIRVGLDRGDTFTAIAKRLGRATSTVSREVNANGGRDGYRAHLAHHAAFEQSRRPK